VLPGERALCPDQLRGRALEHNLPALVAGSRAEVDHPVGPLAIFHRRVGYGPRIGYSGDIGLMS